MREVADHAAARLDSDAGNGATPVSAATGGAEARDQHTAASAAAIVEGGAEDTATAGAIGAAYRIEPPRPERDVTPLIALGLIVLLNMGFAASFVVPVRWMAPAPATERDPRGQVERSETITVELVENPDAESRLDRSQLGASAAPAPDAPDAENAPPQPVPPERTPEQSPSEPQLSLDDFDITMNDYVRAVEAAQAESRRPRARSAEPPEVKGAARQGQQSAYAKSVIAALSRTKPTSYLTRGEVYVRFEIDAEGRLKFVRVIQSSNDPLMDKMAVDAIKSARFAPPPADVDPRDLSYVIHYRFD